MRKCPPPLLNVEASASQSPLLYKLSFNPQSNLELGPYYIGFTTEGATLEVRGLPWVPLPGLLLQIMGFYPLHSQNYWTLSGHLREVEAAVTMCGAEKGWECVLVAQLCPILCDPTDYRPPCSSVYEIL